MTENKRNNISGLVVFLLVFVFFSLVQEEKGRQVTGSQGHLSVVCNAGGSDLHAIISPATSSPEAGFCLIHPNQRSLGFIDFISSREVRFNNGVSRYFNSYQFKFLSSIPPGELIFLQKIPVQEKEDAFLSFI